MLFPRKRYINNIYKRVEFGFSSNLLKEISKFGDFKFNFKNFIANLPIHISNVKNRKSDAQPEKIVRLYNDYTQKNNNINEMRRKLNEIKNM